MSTFQFTVMSNDPGISSISSNAFAEFVSVNVHTSDVKTFVSLYERAGSPELVEYQRETDETFYCVFEAGPESVFYSVFSPTRVSVSASDVKAYIAEQEGITA